MNLLPLVYYTAFYNIQTFLHNTELSWLLLILTFIVNILRFFVTAIDLQSILEHLFSAVSGILGIIMAVSILEALRISETGIVTMGDIITNHHKSLLIGLFASFLPIIFLNILGFPLNIIISAVATLIVWIILYFDYSNNKNFTKENIDPKSFIFSSLAILLGAHLVSAFALNIELPHETVIRTLQLAAYAAIIAIPIGISTVYSKYRIYRRKQNTKKSRRK